MHSALEFLSLLDPSPEATFNIETYTDVPKGTAKPKPDPLGRWFANRTIAQVGALIPKFEALNAEGAAIYHAVNQCQGQRSKSAVVRIRGVHADFDGVSEAVLSDVRKLLLPTIEVQSSGTGNYHFYWLLEPDEEMSTDLAEAINRGLVALGADPAAIDVSHLLRLPGFRNMKYRNGRPQ